MYISYCLTMAAAILFTLSCDQNRNILIYRIWFSFCTLKQGGRIGLVVNASDFGSGDIYSPKVLVIPRNRWLRLNMTEKLFTGTLSHNKTQNKKNNNNKQTKTLKQLKLIAIYKRNSYNPFTYIILH